MMEMECVFPFRSECLAGQMGAFCSSCFGDDHADESSNTRKHRMSKADRELQRQQVAQATEERLRNMDKRGGNGELSRKLAAQSKTPTAVTIQESPLQKIEEALSFANFEHRVPIDSTLFAGGDGNNVEEAPIGYYRFHFWKSDDVHKEHENWIANTDVTGPICVSLLEDHYPFDKRVFYRLLFRSLFGTKSVILLEEDVRETFSQQDKKPNRQKVLSVALKWFIDDERDKMTALEDEFGAMSIRTCASTMSVSSEMVRTLPTSRLRQQQNNDNSEYSSSLSRRVSVRSMQQQPEIPQTINNSSNISENEASTVSIRRRFKELVQVNPFELVKSFTQVKDKEFYQVLLDLERAQDPKVFHFDIVIAEGSASDLEEVEKHWREFTRLLGDQLTKAVFREQSLFLAKNGRVPSNIMMDMAAERRLAREKPASKPAKDVNTEKEQELRHKIAEFITNEARYLHNLHLLEEVFMNSEEFLELIGKDKFKELFEDIPEIIALHTSILKNLTGKDNLKEVTEGFIRDKLQSGEITTGSIGQEIIRLCKENSLNKYANVFEHSAKRKQDAKSLPDISPDVGRFLDEACAIPRMEKQTLDIFYGKMDKHILNYRLLLDEMVSRTQEDDDNAAILLEAMERLERVLITLDEIKVRRDDTVKQFSIFNRIVDCPPDILTARRIYITKMAAYEVEKGEVQFTKRITLYLFNDLVMCARKRRNVSGKIDGKGSKTVSQKTHDFLFICNIGGGLEIKRLEGKAKARKNQVKTFSIHLPSDAQLQRDAAITNLLLVPKRQEKLQIILEKYSQARHQTLLLDSPGQVFLRQYEGSDLYFHVYKQGDYFGGREKKSRIAILYMDKAPLPSLYTLFPEEATDALMIVQSVGTGFRFNIKCREEIVASSETFTPSTECYSADILLNDFTRSLMNCHKLHSIYPPFGVQVQVQQRQLLEKHVEPYTKGVMRKFKELFSKMQKTPCNTNGNGDDKGSIFSFDMSTGENKKKPSVLGKMFGKLKSPLTRRLDDIPECDF